MHGLTAANLRSAYGGECMAHMRYRIWAEHAEREGFPQVARLFRSIALAEQVHASNHFAELRDFHGGEACSVAGQYGIGATAEHLEGGIAGELFEVNEMYPAYLEVAKLQGEQGALRSFRYALSAERVHAELFAQAKQAVEAGRDVELGPLQVCRVCGWTAAGEPPEQCPLCGAGRDKITTFA